MKNLDNAGAKMRQWFRVFYVVGLRHNGFGWSTIASKKQH